MGQYSYLLIGGAILFIGAVIFVVLFITKRAKNDIHFKVVKKHSEERLLKIKAYAEKANWNQDWPKATDVYLLICSMPNRVRQSNASVHAIVARHFKIEHMEAIRMMRVYRHEILQKIMEDARQQ